MPGRSVYLPDELDREIERRVKAEEYDSRAAVVQAACSEFAGLDYE